MSNATVAAPGVAIENSVVLVTGAAGGIGAALVDSLLSAGAAEVIAAGRNAMPAKPGVTQVELDITDAAAVNRAGTRFAGRIDIVINNAGFNSNHRLLSDDFLAVARREMEVNYFGLLNMLNAFVPAMRERRMGTIVNILTVLSHVNLPLMASYCASKAAAHSVTQALRAELAPSGVRVCGIYPPVVDTPMSRQVQTPKLSPTQLAADVLEAIRTGAEDVYPGMAEQAYQKFLTAPKQAERQMAQRLR